MSETKLMSETKIQVCNPDLFLIAKQVGEQYLREETGLIHLAFEKGEHLALIPIPANALFALALCKTKKMDAIAQAEAILSRLMAFQCPKTGVFPVYLHEFPEGRNPYIGLSLFPVFSELMHHFPMVLKNELKKAAAFLAQHHFQLEGPQTPSLAFRYFSSLYRIFAILGEEEKSSVCLKKLESLSFLDEQEAPSSDLFSHYLVGLDQLFSSPTVPKVAESAFAKMAPLLYRFWDGERYAGPFFWEFEAATSLFPFYMGKANATSSDPNLLQLAAVNWCPPVQKGVQPCFKGMFCKKMCEVMREDGLHLSLIEQGEEDNHAHMNGFFPFRMGWGTGSLALQSQTLAISSYIEKKQVVLKLTTPEMPPEKKDEEIRFFITKTREFSLKINGEASNTFQLGDEIELFWKGRIIKLKFKITKGQGTFFGRLYPKNRPAKLLEETSDLCLAFQTVRRDGPVEIEGRVEWEGF